MKVRAAVVAGVLLALAGLAAPGQGVTRDVSLTADGPSPRTLNLKPGDRVQFVNNDSVPHQVVSRSGWQYNSGPIPPGRVSPETPPLTAPGSYGYDDIRGLFFTFEGRLVVPRPAPSPSPTKVSPTPSATPSRSAVPSPTTSPSPSPVPTAPPPPSASASPSAVPVPTAAPTTPPPTAAPEIRYGVQQALVQASPHRYGLPALVATVAIGGVLSLLLRYLLFLVPRAPRHRR